MSIEYGLFSRDNSLLDGNLESSFNIIFDGREYFNYVCKWPWNGDCGNQLSDRIKWNAAKSFCATKWQWIFKKLASEYKEPSEIKSITYEKRSKNFTQWQVLFELHYKLCKGRELGYLGHDFIF